MVLVPNPGGSVSTSHENDMSPPTGLKPARMTGISLHRAGSWRDDTRGHDLFHGENGKRPAAESQATRGQPAVYQVADLLLRDSDVIGSHPKWCGGRLGSRSEEHTSELQSPCNLVCRLLL